MSRSGKRGWGKMGTKEPGACEAPIEPAAGGKV